MENAPATNPELLLNQPVDASLETESIHPDWNNPEVQAYQEGGVDTSYELPQETFEAAEAAPETTERRTSTFAVKAGALVASGLVLLGGALLKKDTAEADAANTPALTGKALEQMCIDEGLKMPKTTNKTMYGRGNFRKQNVGMNVFSRPLPEDCTSEYNRETIGKIFMKNGTNKYPLKLIQRSIRSYADPKIPYPVFRMPAGHNGWPKKLLYKCTPGPRKTKVYGTISRALEDKQTGDVIDQKTNRVPFEVKRPGAC